MEQKTLVVYFSATGTTEPLAEYAAENDFSTPEEVEETYYKEDLVEQFLRDKAYDMIVDSMIVS